NGVFAVPKDSDQDRLIVDAVFANAWFATPPKTKLPDPSHLARLVTDRSAGPLFVAKLSSAEGTSFSWMVEAAAWEPRGVYTSEVARLWTSDYLWTCLSISGSARQHNLSLDTALTKCAYPR